MPKILAGKKDCEKLKLPFFSSSLLVFLLVSSLTSIHLIPLARSASRTWTVNDDGAADFNTIQEAVNAANQGDTISVSAGTYHENVVVNKSVSLVGESKTATIIDGTENGDALVITSNNLTLRGFTIQGSQNYGLSIVSAKNCTVYGNIVRNNHYGLFSKWSSYIIIKNNTVVDNTVGFQINDSTEFVLRNNNVTGNKYNFGIMGAQLSSFIHDIDTSNKVEGRPVYCLVNKHDVNVPTDAGFVAVVNSTNIMVKGLTLTKNSVGMIFAYSTQSQIQDISVQGNAYGIELFFSDGNVVKDNTITANGHGVLLFRSKNNTITLNILTNNAYCIDLEQSTNNTIARNFVESGSYGILVSDGQSNVVSENYVSKIILGGTAISLSGVNTTAIGNTIKSSALALSLYGTSGSTFTIFHNNFINNTKQVQLLNEPSIVWDNGYPSGGNYWSDYRGADANGDGIGDSPYLIDLKDQDRYPLMKTYLTDAIPPVVSIWSPENKTYDARSVLLTFQVSEKAVWMSYCLDGQSNVTITSNTTLSGLPDGSHTLVVCAQDIAGNIGTSEIVFFTVSPEKSRDQLIWIIAALMVVVVAVAISVYFLKVRKTAGKIEQRQHKEANPS